MASLPPIRSDAELRTARLRISNPEDQDGLVWEIPPDAEIAHLDNVYQSEGYPSKKVLCVICGAHRHRDGFTAMLNNGQRVLIGSNCGKPYFGNNWAMAEKSLRRDMNRQYNLRRLDDYRRFLPIAIAELLKWHKPLHAVAIFQKKWKGLDELLFSALTTACFSGGGMLVESVRVRNHVAESERARKNKHRDDDDDDPIYKWEERPIGTISGIQFFDHAWPRKVFDDAMAMLHGIRNEFEKPDALLHDSTLTRCFKQLHSAIEELERARAINNAAWQVFSPQNLALIADFGRRRSFGKYDTSSAGILRRTTDTPYSISIPAGMERLSDAPLHLLKMRGEESLTALSS